MSNGRKVPILGTNFPGSPISMGFVPFSHAMRYWWGNPCISHITKYTIGCESNGKKAPILKEKYEYRFPKFSTYDGFCRIFPVTNFPVFSHSLGFHAFFYAMGNWWENPSISHMRRYTTGLESNGKRNTYFMEKLWKPISLAFPIWWVLLTFRFSMGNSMRKSIHFPCDEVYHRMEI